MRDYIADNRQVAISDKEEFPDGWAALWRTSAALNSLKFFAIDWPGYGDEECTFVALVNLGNGATYLKVAAAHGVTAFDVTPVTPLAAADEALYVAKRGGRDQVSCKANVLRMVPKDGG